MGFGDRFKAALDIFKPNAVAYIVGILIGGVLAGTVILTGPAMVGIMYMAIKGARKQTVEIGDVFVGFQNAGPTIILGLVFGLGGMVVSALTLGLGMLVVLPLSVWAYAHMADQKPSDFNASLSYSIDLLKKDWQTAIFPPLLWLIVCSILGMLACCVGWFVTLPVAYIALAMIYAEQAGKSGMATPA